VSRTRHREKQAKKGCGKEYWASRLHRHGEELGKETKILTHQKERRDARRWLYSYRMYAGEEAG
jgi:hypothetical protein